MANNKFMLILSNFFEEKFTLEKIIIKTENAKLINPFFGGIMSVFPEIQDDHLAHIYSHLKFFYNPYVWVHIIQHYILYKRKKKLGLKHINNDTISGLAQFDNWDDNDQDYSKITWH